MAFDVSTPDIDNYIMRINEIQKAIIPSASIVTGTARHGAGNNPYWLTLARNVTLGTQNNDASILTITIDMLCVRGGAGSGYDGQREREILNDMALTVSYFKRYKDLVTPAYPSIQAHFVPDSATLTQVSRFEGGLQGGAQIVGSLYTLQFKHRLIKQNPSVSPPS